jgi:hypothetical protein
VSSDPFPPADQIRAANSELVAIVRDRLPMRYYKGERWYALFTAAALTRMTDTVDSTMDLMERGRDVDGATLVRSLYEQVVTFAWVAADPLTRIDRWIRQGRWDHLKLHNDAKGFGIGVLSGPEVSGFRRSLGLTNGKKRPDASLVLPPLTKRAEDADDHWSQRIEGLHPSGHPLGFRGLYVAVYRVGSRTVHSTVMGLDPYVTREEQKRRIIVHEATPSSRLLWAIVCPLFGIGLTVAAQDVNWIDEAAVREIVDKGS